MVPESVRLRNCNELPPCMAGGQFVHKECNELPSSLAGVQFVHKECQCGPGMVCPITIGELN